MACFENTVDERYSVVDTCDTIDYTIDNGIYNDADENTAGCDGPQRGGVIGWKLYRQTSNWLPSLSRWPELL